MFKLEYQIFETDEELNKSIDLMKKEGVNTIYGYILLTFNSNQIGDLISNYGVVDPNLEENEMYLYEEDLCWWFDTLFRVAKLLDDYNYVRFKELESLDAWVSLEKNKKELKVTSFYYYDKEAPDVISIEKVHSDNVEFHEKIDIDEFKLAVYNQTKNFLKELENINSDLLKLNEIIELIEFIL